MKRKNFSAASAGVCCGAFLAFAAGCSGANISPEGKDWRLAFVQGQEGQVIFCSAEYTDLYPEAERADLSCRAENGSLTIAGGKEEYSGTYRETDRDKGAVIYTAAFGEKACMMVCSLTERTDGDEWTLVLSSEEYTATFYAD